MSLEKISKIYKNMPQNEKSMPAIVVKGKVLSWSDVMDELRKGTTLGSQAQEEIEKLKFTEMTDELWKLVEEQVKRMPENIGLGILGSKMLTKREILEHVRKRDETGKMVAKMRLRYYKWLLTGK